MGMRKGEAKARPYDNTYAWVVKNLRTLKKPVLHKHPQGAIVWVRLDPMVEKQVMNQLPA